jgi:predicted DNA-binding transcriptional regulator AlpA
MKSALEEFNETYVTADEICTSLGVHRSTVSRRMSQGLLPAPFEVGKTLVWKRTDAAPFIEDLRISLRVRRREAAL